MGALEGNRIDHHENQRSSLKTVGIIGLSDFVINARRNREVPSGAANC
jgi:hypothetical protein